MAYLANAQGTKIPRLSLPKRENQNENLRKLDSKVYLVQEPTIPKHTGRVIDITPLTQWGDIRTIMDRSQVASYGPKQAYAQIHERLAWFRSDIDYIAVAGGDTLAILLVGAVLSQRGHASFMYLRFERDRLPDGKRDPSRGSYLPITVPLTLGNSNNIV